MNNDFAHREYAFPPQFRSHSTPTVTPVSQRARHPEYADRNSRLFSYARWQYPQVQDPTKLADYGFFYTEQGDLVRCFYCSLGLKDFIGSDDPLLEHVRYSGKKCDFLVQFLGPTRLSQIKHCIEKGNPIPPFNSTENSRETQTITGASAGHGQPQTTSPPQPKVNPKYRHPEYKSYSVRLSSFAHWPTYLLQTPQRLAEAGFYYTGIRDVVRCFSCDGGLQKWIATDDPWIEHCVNFPRCEFLKETKGEDYIALALLHNKKAKVSSIPQSNTTAHTQSKPENLSRTFNNLQIKQEPCKKSTTENQEITTKMSEMGYKHVEIESAIQTLNTSNREISIDAVVEEIEKMHKQDGETPKRTREEIVEEHQQLLSLLFCMKCKSAEINSLFLPCQHHRFCTGCAEDLTTCPMCGSKIDHKIKTYRP